jgi:hypothetical protein
MRKRLPKHDESARKTIQHQRGCWSVQGKLAGRRTQKEQDGDYENQEQQSGYVHRHRPKKYNAKSGLVSLGSADGHASGGREGGHGIVAVIWCSKMLS